MCMHTYEHTHTSTCTNAQLHTCLCARNESHCLSLYTIFGGNFLICTEHHSSLAPVHSLSTCTQDLCKYGSFQWTKFHSQLNYSSPLLMMTAQSALTDIIQFLSFWHTEQHKRKSYDVLKSQVLPWWGPFGTECMNKHCQNLSHWAASVGIYYNGCILAQRRDRENTPLYAIHILFHRFWPISH